MSPNLTSAISASTRASCLRFLDLPTELRVIVYEYLTPTVSQRTVRKLGCDLDSEVQVTTQSLSTAILRTCKSINAEAHPVLDKELTTLSQQPLRIKCHAYDLFHILDGIGKYQDIVSLFPPRLLSHFKHLPRVEIAVTTWPGFARTEKTKYEWRCGIWSVYYDIWCGVRDRGLKVDLLHRGTVAHLIKLPGRDEYAAYRFCKMVDSEGETERLNFDSVANIYELKEEIFDEMVESWEQGRLIDSVGHFVGEAGDEEEDGEQDADSLA